MRVCALAGLDMELCELGKESGEMEAHSRDSQVIYSLPRFIMSVFD